ncbi:MAG: YceI family protein [Saprospiraceae bacterium]|nr:YceI family protein [Saprospiraceae bacterium]
MKKSILFSLAAAVVAAFALAFTAPVESMKVDTAASVVAWKGAKVTGTHNGKISVKSGKLDFNNGVLTGGSFEIDMNSITCEDMSGGGAAKLVGHLKSDDFFGAEKYPTSKFVITQVVSRGTTGAYKVVGDLTIKSTTKSIRFMADVKEEGGKMVATAKITIDRSEFDVRFGSGSFIDNLGDKTIYDEFDLDIKLVASK